MSGIVTMAWSPAMVAEIARQPVPEAPVIDPATVKPLLPGIDLWDLWPVQTPDGATAVIDGGALFLILSAPVLSDPDERHAVARIRLMHRSDAGWRDLGALLPDGHAPGSREWAGSAVLDEDSTLTLFFTAAGRRGETAVTFEQRLFETRCHLSCEDGDIKLTAWSAPVECVVADGATYMRDLGGGGALGTIKAFRDPGYFRDPADGRGYLLFTGSLASSSSEFNGAIGIAERKTDGTWSLLPPLVTADGLNNELERPHVVVHAGRYHLFWSTQAKVFAPGGPIGPTGLYGLVADRLGGPWKPLNGTGLVLANPADAPYQAFSWLITDALEVVSFIDLPGLDRPPQDAAEARAHFGGTPAPIVTIALEGDSTRLVP